MHRTAFFPFADLGWARAIELPYAGHLSMVILLPSPPGRLESTERRLATGASDWTQAFRQTRIALALPVWKSISTHLLKDVLSGLGMTLPFSGKADFSLMTTARHLLIGDVIHEALIDVSERGTVAAAVTAVGMVAGSALRPPILFSIDRPFVFMICDEVTGAPLFLGHVVDPRS